MYRTCLMIRCSRMMNSLVYSRCLGIAYEDWINIVVICTFEKYNETMFSMNELIQDKNNRLIWCLNSLLPTITLTAYLRHCAVPYIMFARVMNQHGGFDVHESDRSGVFYITLQCKNFIDNSTKEAFPWHHEMQYNHMILKCLYQASIKIFIKALVEISKLIKLFLIVQTSCLSCAKHFELGSAQW